MDGGHLQLDRSECHIGETVGVYWSFPNYANDTAWIGVFRIGEVVLSRCLERISIAGKLGFIKWSVKRELFDKPMTAINFCYFGCDGVLLLKSPPLVVINPESQLNVQPHLVPLLAERTEPFKIEVHDVHCYGLHFIFNYPDPFLEFHLTHSPKAPSLPHHGQKAISGVLMGTINPKWSEVFCFMCIQSDILEIDIMNGAAHFDSKQFCGTVKVPLCQFLRWKGNTSLTFAIEKNNPNDSVMGILSLTIQNDCMGPSPDFTKLQEDCVKGTSTSEERTDIQGDAALSSQGGATPPRQGSDNQQQQDSEPLIKKAAYVDRTQQRKDSKKSRTGAHPIKRSLSIHATDAASYAVGTNRGTRTIAEHDEENDSPQDGSEHSRQQTDIHNDATISSQGGATCQNVSQITTTQGSGFEQQQDSELLFKKTEDVDTSANSDLAMKDASKSLGQQSKKDISQHATLLRRGSLLTPSHTGAHPIRKFLSIHATDAANHANKGNRTMAKQDENLPQDNIEEEAMELICFMQRSLRNENIRQRSDPEDDNNKSLDTPKETSTNHVTTMTPSNVETELAEKINIADITILINYEGLENAKNECESVVEQLEKGEAPAQQQITPVEPPILERLQSIDDDLRQMPAFQFITRPDLYQYAMEVGNNKLFANKEAIQIIQSIRSDHSQFPMFHNSLVLIEVLNSFAKTDCALPPQWEKKIERKTKKVVFIDHKRQLTSFIDPRLPYEGNELTPDLKSAPAVMRSRVVSSSSSSALPTTSTSVTEKRHNTVCSAARGASTDSSGASIDSSGASIGSSGASIGSSGASIGSSGASIGSSGASIGSKGASIGSSGASVDSSGTSCTQLSYGDKVVAFLRKPDIYDVLHAASPQPMSTGLRSAIERIRREGRPALDSIQRTSDDISLELIIILSLLNDEIGCHTPTSAAVGLGTIHVPTDERGVRSQMMGSQMMDPFSIDYATCVIRILSRDYQSLIDRKGSSLSVVQIRAVELVKNGSPEDLSSNLRRNEWLREVISVFDEEIQAEAQTLSRYRPTAMNTNTRNLDSSPAVIRFQNNSPSVSIPPSQGNQSETVEQITYDDKVVAFLQQPNIYDILSSRRTIQIIPRLRLAIDRIRIDGKPALKEIQRTPHVVKMELTHLLCVWDAEIQMSVPRKQPFIQRGRASEGINLVEAVAFFSSPVAPMIMQQLDLQDYSLHIQREWTNELSHITSRQQLQRKLDENWPLADFVRIVMEKSSQQPHATTPARSTQTSSAAVHITATPSTATPHIKNHFASTLQALQDRWILQGAMTLNIRRDHILADAFKNIMRETVGNLQSKKYNVKWVEEATIDAGGPSREFFFKLSRQLFNPFYGLFQYTNQGSYTVEISPFSSQIEDSLQWFKFAGRVIGFAIIQGHLLDIFFAPHFYKALLNIPFTPNDIEVVDVSFYNSLVYLQQNDPEDLELTFSVDEGCFGEIVETELKAGGSKIPVTEQNKKEYIKLMVDWKLSRGVQEQMKALIAGLRELIPLDHLTLFDARELEWVIAGTPEINMEDWKANTEYIGGYNALHRVIKWFWETVESYSNEQKLKLLQFVTGTSSVPYDGFKALGGKRRFTVLQLGNPDQLPIAHTCFCRLDLPCYSSADDLRRKLTLAIEECEDFALQ